MKKVNHFSRFIKLYDELLKSLADYSVTSKGFWPFNFDHDIEAEKLKPYPEDPRFYVDYLDHGKNKSTCVFLFQTHPVYRQGATSDVIEKFLSKSERFKVVYQADGYEWGIYRRDWRMPTDVIWGLKFGRPHLAVRKDGTILAAFHEKSKLKRWYQELYGTPGELVEEGEIKGWYSTRVKPHGRSSTWVVGRTNTGEEIECVYYAEKGVFGPNGLGFKGKVPYTNITHWKYLEGTPKEQQIFAHKIRLRDQMDLPGFMEKLKGIEPDKSLYTHFGDHTFEIDRSGDTFTISIFRTFLRKFEGSYTVDLNTVTLLETMARIYCLYLVSMPKLDEYKEGGDKMYYATNAAKVKEWIDSLRTGKRFEYFVSKFTPADKVEEERLKMCQEVDERELHRP